jgi:hypothetical protein
VHRNPATLLAIGVAIGLLAGLGIPRLINAVSPSSPRFEVLQVADIYDSKPVKPVNTGISVGSKTFPMIELKIRNVGAGKGQATCNLAINGIHRRSITLGPVGVGEIYYWQQSMHVRGGVRTVLPAGDVTSVPDIVVTCSPSL